MLIRKRNLHRVVLNHLVGFWLRKFYEGTVFIHQAPLESPDGMGILHLREIVEVLIRKRNLHRVVLDHLLGFWLRKFFEGNVFIHQAPLESPDGNGRTAS